MTYTKEQARKEIQKLVDDFRAHEATLEKAAEAQIENNFIRPLFRYLNWNTENAGLSHAHYEFKVQATNKKGLRPDYILNLDGRDVLVMDAKQVKYSMKDPRWLYQVYSYAYSTQNSKPSEKIDFAILTDFQEFIVLDCTLYAAKPEAVNNFRVVDWTYHDYVDKFDELWELFERNNVLNDSRRGEVLSPRVLENDTRAGKPRPYGLWSRYLSPQKVKANRIPPDKAFLAEMDDEKSGWRVLLAKDMKKRNPSADGELITAAVQLLIDRLVFIKALSDREVDRDYLSEIKARVTEAGLGADDAGWFKSCKDIFDELNNFYNGSIFEPRPELENAEVSNKVVQEVIRDLQTENSPYNFAVLPVEILGTIYERFLGRVVRTTEKQVKIEDKPEVRKAGGVYYTPQYIVEYIVRNTLGKLLEGDPSPSPSPDERASSGEGSKRRELTPADVAKLKILDPACGSGSFLLGAYDALIRWHKDYFARAGKEKRDRESFYRDESGQIRLTAKLKREILKNNIFGVDIDPQAVEVTRFSLSLKALEDLREGELTEERTLFHQTVLPDLSQNIKNGNSLIGTDYFGLFQPNTEELKDVKPFDWNSEFPEIMEDGGFDCVIGNPPYLRIQGLQENYGNQIDYFSSQYKSAVKRFDFYLLFTEKGYQLLKSNGRLGYICPHKFVNSDFGSGLREFLVEKSAIDSLVSFGNNLVFEQATTYTGILTLAKTPKQAFRYYEFPDMKVPGIPDTLFTLTPTQFTEYEYLGLSSSPWVLTHTRSKSLLDKFRSLPRLEDVCRKIFQGVVTGVDDIYFLERGHEHVGRKEISVFSPRSGEQITIEKDILKPILKGEDVSRYSQPNYHNYCIYPYELVNGKTVILEEDELASKYPKAYQYLSKFKDELKQLRVKFKTNPKYWYSCHRARSMADFEERRIITPEISLGCNMTISSGDLYHNTKVYSVVLNDTQQENQYYWLGVLNSKIMWWFLSNTGYVLRGGYFVFKTNYLAPFPIRAIDFTNPAEKSQHDKMVALVSQMLELHKSKAGAKTQSETDVYERQIRAVDGQIDSLVYELYGLTEEEIRIVEG